MQIKKHLAQLTSSTILNDTLRLLGGTIGSRVIIIASMPIVTRLYSPDDFALLAVYMAALSIIGSIACLRYELAIPVAQDDVDAANLLVLALGISTAIAGLSLLAVFFAPDWISALIRQPELTPWLWLIPFGVFMSGGYSALQFWATRARRFGGISKSRMSQAATGVLTMLGMGWAGIAPFGLLLGSLFNTSAGSLHLGVQALRQDGAALQRVSATSIRRVFREYRRFPIYSAPEAIATLAGTQVPIVIIAAYSGSEAGHLLLAQQVMAAPMALLGSSVAQVYLSRAPDAFRNGNLATLTLSILRRLAQISLGPIFLIAALAPLAIPMIFGAEWVRSGEIVFWLVPWIALQFLASPVSMVMHVKGQQRAMLLLTTFGGAVRIASVLIGAYYDSKHLIEIFALSSALFYGVCLFVFSSASGLFNLHGEKHPDT